MKLSGALTVSVLLLFVFAGSVFARGEDPAVIQLTEEQISIIVHNCPRDGVITIDLTAEQIAIIVHNYPQIEIETLTLGKEHIGRDNMVELVVNRRSEMVPVVREEDTGERR